MKENIKELGVKFKINKWYLMAYLFPLLFALLTIPLAFVIPGLKFDPSSATILDRFKNILTPEQIEEARKSLVNFPVHIFFISIAQGLLYGAFLNTVPAFGEEIGWRGFLYMKFKKYGFLKSSLLIGTIWGLWHTPIIIQGHNYPGHPYIGILMMVIWCILLTPVFIFVREKTKSVIGASFLHGSINAFAGLPLLVIRGSNLVAGTLGISGFIVLFLFDIFLVIMYGKNKESVVGIQKNT